MSIDFSKVTSLSDQYGVIVQIANKQGGVLWTRSNDGAMVFQVEKITSDTYAGETTYSAEEFILLDIYPKTNGTVSVTYGGLTKTVTDTSGAEEPNAIQVFFGTFNGVADEVETPASGTLTISGDYMGVGCSTYDSSSSSKDSSAKCGCVTAITSWGDATTLPDEAFADCTKLTSVTIPHGLNLSASGVFDGCTSLQSVVLNCEDVAPTLIAIGYTPPFSNCPALTSVTLGEMVYYLSGEVFEGCASITSFMVAEMNEYYSAEAGVLYDEDKTDLVCYPSANGEYTVPNHVKQILSYAFPGCTGLTKVTIHESVKSIGGQSFYGCTGLTEIVILATKPPSLTGSSPFSDTTFSIVVPAGCGEAYKAATGWSGVADRIVEAS